MGEPDLEEEALQGRPGASMGSQSFPLSSPLLAGHSAQAPTTHQPDDDGIVAHLGGCMERGHPIVGAYVGVRSAVFDQVLDDFQVTLLAGQVERCGTILSLGTDGTARWVRKKMGVN